MKLQRKFNFYWALDRIKQKRYAVSDWWWRNIGSGWLNYREQKKEAKWRKKYGYREWETWAPGEGIIEHAMLVLREWIKREWGNPPTYECRVHNKKMHDEVELFVFHAERYLKLIRTPDISDYDDLFAFEERAKQQQETEELEKLVYQELSAILKKYRTKMWT